MEILVILQTFSSPVLNISLFYDITFRLSAVGLTEYVFFWFTGNVFACDCSLLWMNQLTAETINDQVKTALTEAQCQMNDTSEEDGGDSAGAGHRSYTGHPAASGKYHEKSIADTEAAAADTRGSMAGDANVLDESAGSQSDKKLLIKVSSLDEDTCPGKEQPLVDSAPDAAQNSDRGLWQSGETSAALPSFQPSTVGRSLFLPLLSSTALLFAIRFHRC